MEINNNIIEVTTAEIMTTSDRQRIEGKVLEHLRNNCVLISPDDMRGPDVIAESMGLLVVTDKV